MDHLNRREMLGIGVAAGASLIAGCQNANKTACSCASYKKYNNKEFYQADGSLDQAKAKQAFYEMMQCFNYPIPPRLQGEDFWIADFGLGKFTEVGMAGIFWVNNKAHDYLGHEIYLLPGQMIPEHAHVRTAEARPKVEAWQVRHGWVYIYSEGTPTPGVEQRIPPTHKPYCIAKTEKKIMPGEIGILEKPTTKHWMIAGPDGAIVTEYASYHDMPALRFSHPGIKF
jgi:hypothetical protein